MAVKEKERRNFFDSFFDHVNGNFSASPKYRGGNIAKKIREYRALSAIWGQK
jgi:hypothetical protein